MKEDIDSYILMYILYMQGKGLGVKEGKRKFFQIILQPQFLQLMISSCSVGKILWKIKFFMKPKLFLWKKREKKDIKNTELPDKSLVTHIKFDESLAKCYGSRVAWVGAIFWNFIKTMQWIAEKNTNTYVQKKKNLMVPEWFS